MIHNLNPKKTGLAVGALFGGIHFLWALLVMPGLAQGLVNMILWAHMISLPVAINTFDFSVAIFLVLLTFAIGYGMGYVFSYIFNYLHREAAVSTQTPMIVSDRVSE